MEPRFSRKSFIGFCVVMVIIIGVLVWAPWKANAVTYSFGCWDKTASSSGFGYVYSTGKWCGMYSSTDGHFVDGNDAGTWRYANWTKRYGENPLWIWQFEKWLPERAQRYHGFGCAPNGVCKMEYEVNIVWAEFTLCTPYVPICEHASQGVKHTVWANGYSQALKLTD